MKKRFFTIILSVVLLLSLFPQMLLFANASNAYKINGVTVHWDDFSSSPSECWAYANNVYKKIWGQNFTYEINDSNNSLRNLSDSQLTLTLEHLKAYVSNAALGSSLRICNSEYLHGTDGCGHSQIIVQKDSNGFTVFEGGLSASPYCREKYYTWSEYINTGWLGGTYSYIKYIKWPGAPAYSGGASNPGTPANDSLSLYSYNYPTSLDVGKVFSIYGTVSSEYSNITSLTVGVYNTSGSMETGKTVYPNAKSYSISNVDAYVKFNVLPAGTHYYRITATNASGTKQLLNKSFTVVGAPVVGVVRIVDCYRKVTLPAKVVNLYWNPTDTSRASYFDYGPTVGCPCYAEMTDGSIMYKANVTHQGTSTQMWFKYDSSMSVTAVHTYGDIQYEYAHPHAAYKVCACGYVYYTGGHGSRDNCSSCYPASVSASAKSVSMDLASNPTRTVTITVSGNLPSHYAIRFEIDNSSVVGCSWGGWNGNTDPLTFTAKNRGSTSVTVKLLDKDNNDYVLDKLTITVNVSSPSYSINYNANGGSGAPSAQTKYYNEALTLRSGQPIRDGYIFLGWATNSSATSCSYYPGGQYTKNESVTLYAVWKSATDGKCGDNLYWNYDSTNGILTITGTGPMYDYTCAAPWEMYSDKIKSVVVFDGCTNIGDNAFQNCSNLTTVSLPDSVERIGKWAFWCCESIQSINFPENLKVIDEQAFVLCTLPQEVIIPKNVTEIADGAFDNCFGMKYLIFDDCAVNIGEMAFSACTDLTYVDFGNSVHSIGNSAFWLSSISGSVEIPATTTYIGKGAFELCDSLTEFIVDPNSSYYCSIDGILYSKNGAVLYACPCAKEGDCVIPSSVLFIDDGAFFYCMDVQNIYFEGDAPLIGEHPFDYGYWKEDGYDSVYVYEPLPDVTLYYYQWTEGWTSPYWHGYPTAEIAHNYSYKITTAPTSSSTGILTGICSDCNEKTTVVIPKLNTTDYSYIVTQEATCSSTGIERYTWNDFSYGYFSFEVMIPKIPHIYQTVVTSPTCTGKGYTTNTCIVCGVSTVTDYIDPLGHHFEGGICSRCGEEASMLDPCEGYTDINRSKWYHSAADFVIARGIMGSTQTNALTFEPNTACTRSMIVSILYRLSGSPKVTYEAKFPDVKAGKWFSDAVIWAYQNGIVSGYSNGNFGPNDKITREQMAVILKGYADYMGKDTNKIADLSDFPDCSKVTWSKAAVRWAVAEGLISGKAQGDKTYLDPQGNATRAEVASILMRFIENIIEK